VWKDVIVKNLIAKINIINVQILQNDARILSIKISNFSRINNFFIIKYNLIILFIKYKIDLRTILLEFIRHK
jgi:hypothetical protein